MPEGTFADRFQDAIQVAGRHGGFVASSQSTRSAHPTGTIVLRVPSDQFEAALGELKGLGSVSAEEVSGQDVTSQYVDLQARLRNWEAQETVLLDLMTKSASIDDSIKVQRSLQDVQLQIEQRGRSAMPGPLGQHQQVIELFHQGGERVHVVVAQSALGRVRL